MPRFKNKPNPSVETLPELSPPRRIALGLAIGTAAD